MKPQTPIASYLRHLIVTGIVYLAAKWQLPEAGLNEFAQGLALIVIGSGTWAVVKYAPPGLKKFFGLAMVGLMTGTGLTGCGYPVTGTLATPWGQVSHADGKTSIYPRAVLFYPTK